VDFLTSCSFLLAETAAEPTGAMAWIMPILGTLQSLLYVAIGLGFVIFVHELGHFLVAKACGVKCEKFYVGFDFLEIRIPFTSWKIPRSLFKIQIGETEYGIGSLPLGGYVKMLGQDDDPRNAEAEAARTKAHADSTTSPAGEGLTLGSTIEKAGEAVAHTKPADPVTNSDAPAEPTVAVKSSDGKTVLLNPRSYTAKSVPARMAIISAGVIMNAIFAVVFATVAYRMGVHEVPASFGAVSPGDPAWIAGMEPGDRIIQFGKSSQPYEHFRYEDLKRNVVLNGTQRDLPVLVRSANGKESWYELRPVKRPSNPHPSIGVTLPTNATLNVFSEKTLAEQGVAHLVQKTDVPLKDDDKIVAIDGQKVTSGAEVTSILVQKPQGRVTLTIERAEPLAKGAAVDAKPTISTHQVIVEPRPLKELGVTLKAGPIAAVRKGSAAEAAGILGRAHRRSAFTGPAVAGPRGQAAGPHGQPGHQRDVD
jgi:regulator of sigma E protease